MSNVVSLGLRTCVVCNGIPTRAMACDVCRDWMTDWVDAVLSGEETLREMILALTEVADGITTDQIDEYHEWIAEEAGHDPWPRLEESW